VQFDRWLILGRQHAREHVIGARGMSQEIG
jgi:hypothetical protein